MKVSAPTRITVPIRSATNSGCGSAACQARRDGLLRGKRAGDREHRDGEPEARRDHREAADRVDQPLLAVKPAKALPLLLPIELKA